MCIFNKETIRKKIMGATTDSDMTIKYDKENKPGISNLINIYKVFTNKTTEEIEQEFKGSNYGEFKKEVAEVVINEITKIQEKYNQILNSDEIDKVLNKGIEKSRQEAKEKYELMKKRMGFGR